jgi:hypothetical protein
MSCFQLVRSNGRCRVGIREAARSIFFLFRRGSVGVEISCSINVLEAPRGAYYSHTARADCIHRGAAGAPSTPRITHCATIHSPQVSGRSSGGSEAGGWHGAPRARLIHLKRLHAVSMQSFGRRGADGPQFRAGARRGIRRGIESQRQCAPMNCEPPGRLNCGIEMRTAARYGHGHAISGGWPAWFLSRRCT